MDIWIRIVQFINVQHPIPDADQVHAVEMQDIFWLYSVVYSQCLISISTVQPVVDPLDPLNILDCNEEERIVLQDDCQVQVLDLPLGLIVLRTLH